MILNDIGYIRISRFSATTKDELIKELLSLKNKGMKKLILDLRGNGGGYMDAAIDISNEFLFKGNTIVFTKGRNRKPEYFFANGKGHFQQGSLIVLIDELSASASEIVAGAIQDNDRGILIGRRSFGKGLVQSQMTFKDGSAIRLTIARYYTPSGRCIQRPYKDGTQNYYNDFYTHLLNNDIDTLKNDSLKYKTIKGRTVYGGGGIMPDIVIPYEKDSLLYWFNEVNNLGLIYQFAFNLTDKYRDKLSKIKTIEELNKLFIIDDNIYKEFTLFASKNGAKLNKLDNIISKNKICNLLKAYIARNILGEQAFYILLNQNDNIVQIALKILQNEKLK